MEVSGELQVWRRALASQIGREDYIDTRLKHRCCLLGILTIIILVLGGMWRMRRLGVEGREGNRRTEWGCCEGYVFILNTGLPHRDNQRLPGKCTFKKNRLKMRSLGHSINVFSSLSVVARRRTNGSFCSLMVSHTCQSDIFPFQKKKKSKR